MFSEQEFKIEYNNFESEPLIKEIGKDEIIELFILEEKQKRNNLRKCSRLTQTEIENESLVFRKFQSDYKMIKYGLSENEYRKLCQKFCLHTDTQIKTEIENTEKVYMQIEKEAQERALKEW